MDTLPVYAPGRQDLRIYGYETSTHDYGAASFGYIKTLQQSNGTVRTVLQWGSCRDSFQGADNTVLTPGFCYTHRSGGGLDSTTFLAKIEEMLDIPRSVYIVTSCNNITWVLPSQWWFTSFIRKSFYTLMIRSAYSYYIGAKNFDAALYSHNYTKLTPVAVKKFLSGYTVYDYNPIDQSDGWFRQFTRQVTGSLLYEEIPANIARLKPGHELISRRAYDLWLKKGRVHGYDEYDYYNAEQELIREAA